MDHLNSAIADVSRFILQGKEVEFETVEKSNGSSILTWSHAVLIEEKACLSLAEGRAEFKVGIKDGKVKLDRVRRAFAKSEKVVTWPNQKLGYFAPSPFPALPYQEH